MFYIKPYNFIFVGYQIYQLRLKNNLKFDTNKPAKIDKIKECNFKIFKKECCFKNYKNWLVTFMVRVCICNTLAVLTMPCIKTDKPI